MSKNGGLGKFVAGAAIGAGLGILFAPKKGSETRKELKVKLDELVDSIGQIDMEEVKCEFERRTQEIKDELADLDKEKALKIAKKKANEIKKQTEELVDLAIEKGTPVLQNAAEEVRKKCVEVTKEVLKRLEEAEVK